MLPLKNYKYMLINANIRIWLFSDILHHSKKRERNVPELSYHCRQFTNKYSIYKKINGQTMQNGFLQLVYADYVRYCFSVGKIFAGVY